MASVLFTIPIIGSSSSDKATGSIVCTSPAPLVYVLSFSSPPDNRLTTAFCQAFLLALDIIEFSYPVGVVVSTSSIAKFYSNGLDLDHVVATKGFWEDSLYAVFKRLGTYPMPTVALINGHAFAGGLMVAMYHDYRIFNPAKGFLCLNEIDFGMPLQPAMSSIFMEKIPSFAVYRSLVLEAHRFAAKEALEGGIVDGLGGLEEALAMIKTRKLTEKGKSGIYEIMKRQMIRETLGFIDGHENEQQRAAHNLKIDDKRRSEGKRRVLEWERNTPGAKSKL